MANKINYQKLMEDLIKENCIDITALHVFCFIAAVGRAAHTAYRRSRSILRWTVFYYNPNIYPPEEYHMRAQEQKRFIDEFPVKNPVHFVEGVYDTRRFYDMARGMEAVPEGGERCFKCYRLRLEESAQYARSMALIFYYDTFHQPVEECRKAQ